MKIKIYDQEGNLKVLNYIGVISIAGIVCGSAIRFGYDSYEYLKDKIIAHRERKMIEKINNQPKHMK